MDMIFLSDKAGKKKNLGPQVTNSNASRGQLGNPLKKKE